MKWKVHGRRRTGGTLLEKGIRSGRVRWISGVVIGMVGSLLFGLAVLQLYRFVDESVSHERARHPVVHGEFPEEVSAAQDTGS